MSKLSRISLLAGLSVLSSAALADSNIQSTTQSGVGQQSQIIFTNTSNNTATVDQSGALHESLVEIIRGEANTVAIVQAPLVGHDVNLLIRRGVDNEVDVNQGGVDNNAGEPGGARMRIVDGAENIVDIDQNSLSGFNSIDMDILNGDNNEVTISQQFLSGFNNTDVRIENGDTNEVDVFQSFGSGGNSADIDILDGNDNEVEVIQAFTVASSATVDIFGSNADVSIEQVLCDTCDATHNQQ